MQRVEVFNLKSTVTFLKPRLPLYVLQLISNYLTES